MSLTVALNTAVSGLFANQNAIAATSENIANLNTVDFSRREATFITDAIPGQFAGVNVEITRAGVDRFLQSALFSGAAGRGEASVVSEALSRIEASLGAPGDNLSFANRLDEAFAAFVLLSADPSSISARSSALSALDAAFQAFGRTLDAIDNEAAAADARLTAQTERVNTLLEEIFNLNNVVPDSDGAGDQIDARLRELAGLININVSRADDGRVSVSAANGQSLVTPGGYNALTYTAGLQGAIALSSVDPASGARTQISANINVAFSGGEIGGLLALRNVELPAITQIVDAAARDVATALNAAYGGNTATGAAATTTNALITETGGRLAVNQALLDDPTLLAIARPPSGAGGGVAGGANDGAGAAAIADLALSVSANNATQAVARIGAAARVADDARISADAFASSVEQRAAGEGGVNLDQELSNLILFQRSYNANARVIAAIDELYQSLLNII